MHRKHLFLVLPVLCVLLVATSLYLGRDHLTRLPKLHLDFPEEASSSATSSQPASPASLVDAEKTGAPSSSTTPLASPTLPTSTAESTDPIDISNGSVLSADKISPYVTAILEPAATNLPRLKCPPIDTSRYQPLLEQSSQGQGDGDNDGEHIEFFFALDLRNSISLLPRLIGSIVEAILFLGPSRCSLSIVEGNSPDGTGDVLAALEPFLERLGIHYTYRHSDINPGKGGSRIGKLAQLRNLALQPLFDHAERRQGRNHKQVEAGGQPGRRTPTTTTDTETDTTVLFINDVALCPSDLLELALQRRVLGADMTCAMDWTYAGADPTFYDVWVARGMNGDSFFRIPSDGSWDSAWNLFWDDPAAKARYNSGLPFQVFSCWNGAVAFGGGPLMGGSEEAEDEAEDEAGDEGQGQKGLRFRDIHNKGEKGREGECTQGEPQLFCRDLWFRGHGKIAVVPAVNLEYSDEKADKIKRLKGYTSDVVRGQTAEGNMIDWVLEPPEQVRCMPTWNNQYWQPWNMTLHP